MSANSMLDGKFYWPSDEYSIPADNLCWHRPPSPNADFFCVRPLGHPGKHEHHWSPTIKDHSHKTAKVIELPLTESDQQIGDGRARL